MGGSQRRSARYTPCSARSKRGWRLWSLVLLLACLPARGEPPDETSPSDYTPDSLELTQFEASLAGAKVEGTTLLAAPTSAKVLPTAAPAPAVPVALVNGRVEDPFIVISTIDGGVETLDARTGVSKDVFPSGPALMSSSFFTKTGGIVPRGDARNQYFVMPDLDGSIQCYRADGTKEILASNVFDLLESPIVSCLDYDDNCGLIFGEKTTKIFAVDRQSGKVKWVNTKPDMVGPEGMSGEGGGKGDAPILLQRDDYVVRSLNVRDGHEEWNVTLSDIFAIDASESEGSKYISTTEDLALVPEWQWSEDPSKRNPIVLRMVHPESQKELWKHELSALPTSIYMVKDSRWLPLEVPDKVLSIAGPRRDGLGRALAMDHAHKGGWGAPKSASPGLPLPQPLLLAPTLEPSDGGARKGVNDRDIITLRKMKDLGLLESRTGAMGPWSRRKKMHPRALAMSSSSGTCGEWESAKRGQCPSRLSPAIEHLMPGRSGNSNHHQMCAGEERCEAIVPAGEHGLLQYVYEFEDVTASWSGSAGMCSPQEAEPLLIDQLKVRSENKLLQTGMFLTFETLATLVIVVFIIGIGFVLVISGYQDRAQGERTLDPRVLLEELMHRHTSAKYEIITAPPITPSTSETITDCDQPSQNSLRASSEPNRVEGRCDDTDTSQQLAIVPLFPGDDSSTSGPQSARPRRQPPGALLKTAAAAATATVELQRCHSLPSMPPLMPPRGSGSETFDVDRHASRGIVGGRARTVVTLGAGGRIIEHKFDNSMEGEPLQRVPAVFRPPTPKKASNSTFSPLRPDRATSFPRVLAAGFTPASLASTGNQSPRVDQGSSGSGTPTSAMVVRMAADANGGASPKQVVSSPTKPPSLAQNMSETAMVSATTIETISDSSGQPILFLSTSRYKNEFRELCKLGKGGFGTVFKSANKLDGHEYAIKKIRLSSATQWSHQLDKVLREVKILALLEHPNIIRYHQAWLERVPEEELHIVHCNASTTDQSFSDFFHHDDSDYSVDDMRHRSRRLTDSAAYNMSQSQSGWGGVGVLSPIPTRMTHAGRRRRMSSSLVEFGSSGPGLPRSPATREGSPSLDGSVGFKQGVGGGRGGQGAGGGDDDKSRISEWSQEEDDEDDAMSEYSEVDGKSELDDDSGHPIVFARDMEDVGSSRPRTPCSSGAGGGGLGSSVFSGQNGYSSSASRGKAAGAGGIRGRDQHRGRGRRGAGRQGSKDHAIVFDLCLYIQMQYCSNRTLKDFLEIPERLNGVDKAQALQFALQIARGVKYVHERGLIHRDLKPTNCFLVGEGSIVKIGDFGLSRHIGPPGAEPTLPGSSSPSPMSRRMHSLQFVEYDNTAGVGTPVYGSPEQLSGGDYDEKTDIFSLGVMLFELFHTGFATGMERLVVMRKLHDGQLPEEWARSEPELTDLVMRMLTRSPSKRPGAPDVVAKLEFLQGKPLVLPLDFDSFPRDAVLVRAVTQERDGVVQDVMKTVKGHGGGGLMKQYAFRSTSEGRAVIEVLLDGSRLHEVESVIGLLRQVSGVDSVKMLGHAKNALPPPIPTPIVTAS